MNVKEKESKPNENWIALILVGLAVGIVVYLMARNQEQHRRTAAQHQAAYVTPASYAGPSAPPATPAAAAIESLALGMGYLQQPGYEIKAEAAFTDAAVHNPGNAKAWLALGWARLNNGRRFSDAAFSDLRFRLSKEAFENCLRIDPPNQSAHLGLGQLAMMRRRFDEAERHFLDATGDPGAWTGLMKLYLLQERFAEAEPWGVRVVESNPNDHFARMMLKAASSQSIDGPLRNYLEANLLPPTPLKLDEMIPAELLDLYESSRDWIELWWDQPEEPRQVADPSSAERSSDP